MREQKENCYEHIVRTHENKLLKVLSNYEPEKHRDTTDMDHHQATFFVIGETTLSSCLMMVHVEPKHVATRNECISLMTF
jgi:hypothetical protein